jgi:2-hydroxy-3-keto-5-methylthiopentenyl-1-phosphate phosphatase
LTAKSGPEVLKLLNNLDKESKALIEDVATLAIYSGQSYEQVWNLTHEEKRIFLKVLKEKISIDKGIKPTQTLTQERF